MMYRAEALSKSVENSSIFKDFKERVDYAVENGLFSVELEHPDIDEEAPQLTPWLATFGREAMM